MPTQYFSEQFNKYIRIHLIRFPIFNSCLEFFPFVCNSVEINAFVLLAYMIVSFSEIGEVDLLDQKFLLFRALIHFSKTTSTNPALHFHQERDISCSFCLVWVYLPVEVQKGEKAAGTLKCSRQKQK